jgi:cold shock CspA family protein
MRTIGTVKWFDAAMGAGCAVSEGGVQATFELAAIEPFGLTSIDVGTQIVFEMTLERGELVVAKIYEIAGQGPCPQASSSVPVRSRPTGIPLGRGHAKVNWFDPQKGYGFVITKGHDDTLVHRSVVEAAG